MRKNKAIGILNIQRLKLEDNSYYADRKWTIQTQDYIKYFFGENSPQLEYIKNYIDFNYYRVNSNPDEKEAKIQKEKDSAIRFINDCIEIIENKGLVNQNHNFLERANNTILITVILFLISGLISGGYIFGVSTTDSKNVELRQENKLLKDSLNKVRTTFKIPNNITK